MHILAFQLELKLVSEVGYFNAAFNCLETLLEMFCGLPSGTKVCSSAHLHLHLFVLKKQDIIYSDIRQ